MQYYTVVSICALAANFRIFKIIFYSAFSGGGGVGGNSQKENTDIILQTGHVYSLNAVL